MVVYSVTVELLRSVEREGRLLVPGSTLRVSLDEARALFATGFAKPIGASSGWNTAPCAAWVSSWRG